MYVGSGSVKWVVQVRANTDSVMSGHRPNSVSDDRQTFLSSGYWFHTRPFELVTCWPWIGAGSIILAPEKIVGDASNTSPTNTSSARRGSMPRRALSLLLFGQTFDGQSYRVQMGFAIDWIAAIQSDTRRQTIC